MSKLVKSASSCESSDGGVELLSPVVTLQAVIDCGVAPNVAAELLGGYYRALGDLKTERKTSTTTRSMGSRASAKSLRTQRWLERVSVMSEPPGQCYMHAFRWSRRPHYLEQLGAFPTMEKFVSVIHPGDIDYNHAITHYVYRIGGEHAFPVRYHVASEAPDLQSFCVGNLYQVISCVLTMYPNVNQHGLTCDAPHDRLDTIPIVGTVGARADQFEDLPLLIAPAPALDRLSEQSFDDCRCMVHLRPGVVCYDDNVGCQSWSVGTAGVIRAAASGEPRLCDASDSRANDAKLLRKAAAGDDAGALRGCKAPASVRRLCTSAPSATIDTFGRGYCYLQLIQHSAWWRVARLLGPNPEISSLMRFLPLVGQSRYQCRVRQVAFDLYHVEFSSDGIGGRFLYDQLLDACGQNPGARIGAVDKDLFYDGLSHRISARAFDDAMRRGLYLQLKQVACQLTSTATDIPLVFVSRSNIHSSVASTVDDTGFSRLVFTDKQIVLLLPDGLLLRHGFTNVEMIGDTLVWCDSDVQFELVYSDKRRRVPPMCRAYDASDWSALVHVGGFLLE